MALPDPNSLNPLNSSSDAGPTDLLQKIKCLNKATASSSSLKDKAIAFAKKQGEAMKAAAMATARQAYEDAKASAKAALTALLAPFKAFLDQAEAARKEAMALWKKIKGFKNPFATQCPDLEGYDPLKPSVNMSASIVAMPASNSDLINEANPDLKMAKEVQDNKTISLGAVTESISIINDNLGDKSILDQRETVRLNRGIHPLIDNNINGLSYFRPVSEYTGAAWLGYTVDKQSLRLKDWGKKEKCIRKNIKFKLDDKLSSEIQRGYVGLNKNLKNNISSEVIKERKNFIIELFFCQAYHIEGDSNYYNMHIRWSILKPLLSTILNATAGDRVAMINYLAPIKQQLKITNEIYAVDIQGESVNINNRGEVSRLPFTSVNEDSVTPTT